MCDKNPHTKVHPYESWGVVAQYAHSAHLFGTIAFPPHAQPHPLPDSPLSGNGSQVTVLGGHFYLVRMDTCCSAPTLPI